MNSCTREIGILWLGGNLTSDTTGGTGTFAAATVQDEVRDDLRNDDIKACSSTPTRGRCGVFSERVDRWPYRNRVEVIYTVF